MQDRLVLRPELDRRASSLHAAMVPLRRISAGWTRSRARRDALGGRSCEAGGKYRHVLSEIVHASERW